MSKKILGAVTVALALVGCGAVEPAGSTVELVETASLDGRTDLYIDPAASSWRPATLAELGDSPTAVAVELEVLDGVVVAWVRDDVAAADRTRADIVAIFRAEPVNATPAQDSTRPDGTGGTIRVPGGNALPGSFDSPYTGLIGFQHVVRIRWVDVGVLPPQEDVELWNQISRAHPGCA